MTATYPDQPGYKVDGPSREAAAAMVEHAPTLRDRILDLFGNREWTTDEAAEHLNESILSVRPRFTELAHLGWIEKTTTRRTNSSGMTATVWRKATARVWKEELF